MLPRTRLAVAADAIAFAAFALVGMASHDGISAQGFLRDALPLAAGWSAAAAGFALYRRPTRRALLLTWIVGVPLGVLVRALALGRATEPRQLAFLATTLVFSLAFVALLRLLATWTVGQRAREDSNLRPSD